MIRSIVVALLFSVAGPPRQLEQQYGRIQGTAVRADTNQPVSGARLTLIRVNANTGATIPSTSLLGLNLSTIGAPPAPPGAGQNPPAVVSSTPPAIPSITTDRSGQFAFSNLEPGSYRLAIVSEGYVRQEYGQKAFPGQGAVLNVAAGQPPIDLIVKLTMTGNVSGRLRKTDGQPAVGVPVQLFRVVYNAQGQRVLSPSGVTRSNDRGDYRLYWVTPGRYFLAAGSPPGPPAVSTVVVAGQAASPNDPNDSYLFTYYPGTTNLAQASSLDITSASELVADLPLDRQEFYRVRGRVIDSVTGRPPASIAVSLSYSSPSGGGGTMRLVAPYNSSTGAMEIRDVPRGDYTLLVSAPGAASQIPLSVFEDIDNLQVLLSGTFSFSGRMTLEGQPGAALDRVRVQLQPVTGLAPASPSSRPDGTFQFDGVFAGSYRVSITSPEGEYFIKSARFDGADVFNALVLDRAPRLTLLEIVLGSSAAHIEGIAMDEQSRPVSGATVVLVPNQNRARPEFFKSAVADQSGRFLIRGIAPGEYTVLAWEALENFAYFDPGLLQQVESQGRKIVVTESTKLTMDTRVIAVRK